jgi:glycosyltransferase involved in cell wall biosynthesis
MRIHFIGPVPPLRGGIAQHSNQLLDALVAAGHEVGVSTWAQQYPSRLYPGEERDPSATPRPGTVADLRWWSPLSWWRAGRRARRADLLLVPWVTPFQAPAYLTAFAASAGTPVVAVVHNPLPHERRSLDRVLARAILGRLTGGVSHAGTATAELHELAAGLRVVEVPHPPNLPLDVSPYPPGPPWRLLFIGFIRPYKGLDLALDALVELRARRDDVTLTVAGEVWGPVEPWTSAIRERGLDEVVDLRPGYVPNDLLGQLLAEHHVVLAPYRSATQSGVVPLAQAVGRPTVATDVGGLSEVVTSGVDGILVPADDAPAFARGIEDVLADGPAMAVAASRAATSWADVAAAVVAASGVTADPPDTQA